MLRHLGSELVLNFDLEEFFPTIHFGRVKGLFSKKPYSLPDQVALTLAQICCDNGVLPAGAPTSPIVANMLCAQMDAQLKHLARTFGCMYTRYADDITFSTKSRRFHPAVAYRDPTSKQWNVGDEIKKIVSANLFKIHGSKTYVRNKHSRQEVAGVRINSGLNVKNRLIRQIRAMLHAWETFGEEAAQAQFHRHFDRKQHKKNRAEFKAVVRGKIEFVGFIRGRDNTLYLKLLMRLLSLDPMMKARPVVPTETAADKVLEQAVWLIVGEDDDPQATAFAAVGFGLLTAFHTVEHVAKRGETMFATRPGYDENRYPIAVVNYDEVRDVVQLSLSVRPPVEFKIGVDDTLQPGQQITLLGFPRYQAGDGINIHRGTITQSKIYNKVRHFVIQPVIFRGNSGGPILDSKNCVVGIAVKGYELPDKFDEQDELSSFVPIGTVQKFKNA